MANPRQRFNMFAAQEQGVGGLLLLFILTQVASLIILLIRTKSILAAFDTSTWTTVGNAVPSYHAVVVVEAIAHALRIMLAVIGFIMIWTRDRLTIAFYTGYLAFVIVWGIADHLAAISVYDGIYAMLAKADKSDAQVRALQSQAGIETFQMIVYATIWLVYWRTSDRVRRTFQPVTAPLPMPAPVGPG
jgi:Protein of unknown function (DUF2569)